MTNCHVLWKVFSCSIIKTVTRFDIQNISIILIIENPKISPAADCYMLILSFNLFQKNSKY